MDFPNGGYLVKHRFYIPNKIPKLFVMKIPCRVFTIKPDRNSSKLTLCVAD